VAIKNIVVPYMSIKSPSSCASALTASSHASIEPVITGIPALSPRSAATEADSEPAGSPAQPSGGSSSQGATTLAHGSYQRCASRSKSGVHWLAEW
jgi:hypothetical protein